MLLSLNRYSAANGGKTSNSSSPTAPTYNSNVMNLNTPSVTATSTVVKSPSLGAGALLLKILSNSSAAGSGASIDDLLTDKEISAKAIASGSNKQMVATNIAATDFVMNSIEAKSATSAKSSSFLKSMLKVSNTPTSVGATIHSTSFSTYSTGFTSTPTAAAVLGPALSESIVTSNSQKLADILRLNLDSPSHPVSTSSSRLQSSGSGLVPASIQLKNLAKKVKDKEPEIEDISPGPPSSHCISPSPTIPVNVQSSTSILVTSAHATSAPQNSMAKNAALSASVSLLAALSISPKSSQLTTQQSLTQIQTQTHHQSVVSSPNRIESSVVEVSATGVSLGDGQSMPRRVSVMHLFQSQAAVPPVLSNHAQSDPILVSSPVSVPVGSRKQENATNASLVHNGDLLLSQGKEVSVSKSVTLFAALNGNMGQDDAVQSTKLQNQPPPRYSQQSKAMPSAHVAANASSVSVSNQTSSNVSNQAPKLSLTPQSLSMKGSEADAKTETTAMTRIGSDISPSLKMLIRPMSPTMLPAFPSTLSAVNINTPASPPAAPVATTTRMQLGLESTVLHSASPSSFILSDISQYIHQSRTTSVPSISATASPASSNAADTVNNQIFSPLSCSSSLKSDVQSPKSVGAHAHLQVAPTAMKSLSPSDLTGYIRTFRSQS